MDRPLALALGSAGAGVLSFSTLLVRASGTPVAHAAENATWFLIVAAVALGLLASDGAGKRERILLGAGIALAAVRAALVFAL